MLINKEAQKMLIQLSRLKEQQQKGLPLTEEERVLVEDFVYKLDEYGLGTAIVSIPGLRFILGSY